jgi:hypothetical protein
MAAADVEKNLEQCFKGKHDLIVVYRICRPYDEEEVVRWCRNCGSIVVDLDVDNRTHPGRIMKMESPRYIINNGT